MEILSFADWIVRKKDKRKGVSKSGIYNMYFMELLSIVANMFEYEGLPETVDLGILERYACLGGMATIAEVKGDYYALRASYSGEVDPNGVGKSIIANGANVSMTVSRETIPVLRNNDVWSPDFKIWEIADCLTENEVSEHMQLVYSRLYPVPIANNNAEKMRIETTINDMINGCYSVAVNEKKWTDDNEPKEILNITDNSKIDKIQYLNLYYNNIIKRFWDWYGQPINSTGKVAQALNDEIHSHDHCAFVYPEIKLKERKKFIERCNELYDWNASVDYSECWKLRLEDMKHNEENVSRETNSERLENEEIEEDECRPDNEL